RRAWKGASFCVGHAKAQRRKGVGKEERAVEGDAGFTFRLDSRWEKYFDEVEATLDEMAEGAEPGFRLAVIGEKRKWVMARRVVMAEARKAEELREFQDGVL